MLLGHVGFIRRPLSTFAKFAKAHQTIKGWHFCCVEEVDTSAKIMSNFQVMIFQCLLVVIKNSRCSFVSFIFQIQSKMVFVPPPFFLDINFAVHFMCGFFQQ